MKLDCRFVRDIVERAVQIIDLGLCEKYRNVGESWMPKYVSTRIPE